MTKYIWRLYLYLLWKLLVRSSFKSTLNIVDVAYSLYHQIHLSTLVQNFSSYLENFLLLSDSYAFIYYQYLCGFSFILDT